MSNYTRVERVLIGDGANAALPANTTLPTMAAGDLFLLDEQNNIVANVAAANAIPKAGVVKIAQGLGNGKIRLSSDIRGSYTSGYRGKVYAAPTEQITYVGYDPVANAGTIAVLDNTNYRLDVVYLDGRRIHGEQQTRDLFYYYTPLTGSSLVNLAFGIQKATEIKFNTLPGGQGNVSVEVVTNGTYTSLATGATITATNGSKILTASNTTHALVAGDLVRIGGSPATNGVYQVESVAGATINLTTIYQGVSGTGLAAGEMSVVTAYGFKLTGIAVPTNIPFDTYTKVQFDASFGKSTDDLDYVTVTTTQKMFPGTGYWEQVKDAEYFAQGNLGVTNRTLFPVKQLSTYYVVGATYDTVVIEHYDEVRADFQDTQNNPIQTTIYIARVTVPAASGEQAGYTTVTDFVAILNGYFSTVVGFTAINTF